MRFSFKFYRLTFETLDLKRPTEWLFYFSRRKCHSASNRSRNLKFELIEKSNLAKNSSWHKWPDDRSSRCFYHPSSLITKILVTGLASFWDLGCQRFRLRIRNFCLSFEEVAKNWLDAKTQSGRAPGRRCEHVGHARQDAHVGLVADVAEALGKDLQLPARDQLSRRHPWTVTTIGRIQMTLHVRIPDDAEDLVHLEVVSDLIIRDKWIFCAIAVFRLGTSEHLDHNQYLSAFSHFVYAPKDDFRK